MHNQHNHDVILFILSPYWSLSRFSSPVDKSLFDWCLEQAVCLVKTISLANTLVKNLFFQNSFYLCFSTL